VLVHGGMAQNVGPILEMVTEKYLLRSEAEWAAARACWGFSKRFSGRCVAATCAASAPPRPGISWTHPDDHSVGEQLLHSRAHRPGASCVREAFWGFWMLGGMSGGGMGFIFAPDRKAEAQRRLQEIMSATRRELQHALPFAMEPVVYDFAINQKGTFAELLSGPTALMPSAYYALTLPPLLRQERHALSPLRRQRSTGSARPAGRGRNCAGWCRPCLT